MIPLFRGPSWRCTRSTISFRSQAFTLTLGFLTLALPAASAQGVHAAGTYYVDAASPSCSDSSGAGTDVTPYCTITAALNAHPGHGVVILVRPGVYREQVTVWSSGTTDDPVILKALGTVVIDGSDDFSSPALWTAATGNVWLARSVSWAPKQVFVDGTRLGAAEVGPDSLAPGSFRYLPDVGLYVNLGGLNPGTRATLVGHRGFGFRLSATSSVVIEGFSITRTDDRGIYLSSGSNNVTLLRNDVSFANRPGLQISNSTGARVASNRCWENLDHGIVFSSVTGSILEDNECFANSKPAGLVASGIYLSGSSRNVLRNNRAHHNEASGFYVQNGSNDNVSTQNRSWSNGHHGFDLYAATGARHVGDLAWGNNREGFSLRGGSVGAQLHNCIAAENALGTGGYQLYVESGAVAGFASDDNLWWASNGQAPIRYATVPYASVVAFTAATGHDTRSLQDDPRFVDPAAGDFHVRAGSRIIDSGNSSIPDWPESDAEGRLRVDDPAVPNIGVGPVAYADRGPLEFIPPPPPIPPDAALEVRPATGEEPLAVMADASASRDPDGTVVSYRFDFGDGTTVGPQVAATAAHVFAAGTWMVTVTVRDNRGNSDSASVPVVVTPRNRAPSGHIDSPDRDVAIVTGQSVVLTGSGADPDGNLPLTYAWDLGGGAPNRAEEDPGPVTFVVPGTYTIALSVTDARGMADPSPDTRTLTVLTPPLPSSVDEIHWTITGGASVTISWRGPSDVVRFGVSQAYGRVVRGKAPIPYPTSSTGPFWEARIGGLRANTLYHYSIGGGSDHTFSTPPASGLSDFLVLAEGDIGEAQTYPRVAAVQSLIAGFVPDFVLMLGDLSYANDHGLWAVDRHFNDMMVWSQDAAYMPCWGNHDWPAPDDLRNYTGRLDLPNAQHSPGSPDSIGEDWYWFDYGNVRFIAYPEPWLGAVSNWNVKADSLMDLAQADPNITYIVTFGHRPAYSSGHHAGSPSLKGYLDALGIGHSKYMLNLNGHSHNYERTYPQGGVTHVTAGTGGSSLEPDGGPACLWRGGCPAPPWSAFRAMHHGALKLRFTETGIRGEMICGPPGNASNPNDIVCSPGQAFDAFSIGAPNRGPVITAVPVVTVQPGAMVSVPVAAADPEGESISSLTADLSELPSGNDATFTVAADHASGTLRWTTSASDGPRTYFVRLRAANALRGEATLAIRVYGPDREPRVSAPDTVLASEGTAVVIPVTALDPDGQDLESLAAGLSGLPAGNGAEFSVSEDRTSGSLTWTPVPGEGNRSYPVTFIAGNARFGAATTIIRVGHVDQAPIVIAPPAVLASPGFRLTIDVTAQDPDGDAIQSLAADLSGLPQPNDASFAVAAGNRSGTLSWTPAPQAPDGEYRVSFTAANARIGAAALTIIRVARSNQPPAARVGAIPTDGPAPHRVVIDASASSDPDGDPLSFLFDFGDGRTLGPQGAPTALHTYAVGTWTATVIVADARGLADTASVLVTAAVNLVGNPSFETAMDGWRGYSGGVIARIEGGYEGAYALEVTGPTPPALFGINDSPNWIATTGTVGARCRFSAWVRSVAATGKAKLRVREYQTALQIGPSSYSPAVPLTPAWQNVAVDHVVGVAGSTLDFQVLDAAEAAGEVFQVDNIGIRLLPSGPSAMAQEAIAPAPPRALSATLTPNPLTLRSSGTLRFTIARAGPVRIGLYDLQGRFVRDVLDSDELPPGEYAAPIQARDAEGASLRAGVYFYRLTAAEGRLIGRFVVLP